MDNSVLQNALLILDDEVIPTEDPVLSSSDYRKNLTKALLYKVPNRLIFDYSYN